MTTTIALVYFTVFFQGITIKPLVKILNVKTAEKRKPTMNERIHERLMDHAMAAIEDILGQHGNYHIRDKYKFPNFCFLDLNDLIISSFARMCYEIIKEPNQKY
jgi:NhaP-type Na+/H+ or K+/H+ antiporter